MEQTTAEVVRGARLPRTPGGTKEEIENVSKTPGRLDPEHLQCGRQQSLLQAIFPIP